MKSRLWNRKSFKVLIALIAILLVLAPFSLANTDVSKMDISEVAKYGNGTTVFSGDEVIDNSKVNKYPVAINIDYLVKQFITGDILGGLFSITTGSVPVPASEIVQGNVTRSGLVGNFTGPGYMEFKNNKIIIHPPKDTVWGYNAPYTKAIRTPDGINIYNVKTNKTIEHIDADSINNETIKKEYIPSGDDIKTWYAKADPGDAYTLEYCVSAFNDGRSYVSPDVLREHFPNAYNYSKLYPSGSPVMIYKSSALEEVIVSDAYTYLGDHSEYGSGANYNREINARQFCNAWNNTVIPANGSACGKEGIGFAAIKDEEADGGWASHGVCPPARTLRDAVMALGIPLPVGMTTGENAVLYGYSPATGIIVTNTLDYPIKIVMWTEGEGTGMVIYCKIIGYKNPKSMSDSNTNSTDNSTDLNT